ncbi:hypothetical protein FRX31_032921, partial [Thalictrum thalictroides]
MLLEGLQHLTKLKELKLLPLREPSLKPDRGEENYKIKNNPAISYLNKFHGSTDCERPPSRG